jgi:hypothetical protein
MRMKRPENIQVDLSPLKIVWVKEVRHHETSTFLQPTHISKEGIHICAHLLSSTTKNDAHTYLSVRDTVFRKHEKIAFLKTASATGIQHPTKIFDFCFNNHFLQNKPVTDSSTALCYPS